MTTEREEIELHPAVGELIVKMRADLATAIARADAAEFALQCEATRHEETRAAVRAFAPQCSQCEALATRRLDGYGDGEMMARVIRTEPARHPTTTPQSEATLDDAARYLRALWPRGERMTYETGEAWLRWSSLQGPDEAVSVPCVEGEAPSATLARLVARLREMAVAERDAAEARVRVLRAAIGGES